MAFEKPVTTKQKEVCNIIYKFIGNSRRYVTKEEICNELGWKYNSSNDRKVRDCINTIKKVKPIVATPDCKGYFLCRTKEDIEQCEHQWKYIDSIIEDLELTKKPLIEFYEKMKKFV